MMTDQAGAHTPGPWLVQETEYGHEIRMGEAIKITNFHDGHLVIEYNHMCELGDDSEENAQYYEAEANARLIASASAMAEELERLKKAGADYDREVTQILGRELGYPKYCDDPENFPDATEADGVCVGEHVAATLAQEAAEELTSLRAQKALLVEALKPLASSYKAMITAHECPNQADAYYGLWRGNREHWERLAALLAAEVK